MINEQDSPDESAYRQRDPGIARVASIIKGPVAADINPAEVSLCAALFHSLAADRLHTREFPHRLARVQHNRVGVSYQRSSLETGKLSVVDQGAGDSTAFMSRILSILSEAK